MEIELKFNRTAQDLENARQIFRENADQILAGVQALPDSYGREKAVHDALIDKITYDMGAEMNQSAYSAMVNGRTVCAGYARAFQYLLQQLGIPVLLLYRVCRGEPCLEYCGAAGRILQRGYHLG